MKSDARQFSPACERNRDPILAVLREELPASGRVLEIASGTGMHAAWFAPRLPQLRWQPTDGDPASLASISAWRESVGAENLLPPMALEVTAPWPVREADAVFCANMIHISPWECALALIAGASLILPPGAPLVLYGPYRRGGRHTAESNAAFDASLRSRDPRWGVRDLEAVAAEVERVGKSLSRVVEMPANNLTVVFR